MCLLIPDQAQDLSETVPVDLCFNLHNCMLPQSQGCVTVLTMIFVITESKLVEFFCLYYCAVLYDLYMGSK
jgi:hypothetical protein